MCEKYRDQINSFEKKERELVKDIETVRKQIEQAEKTVRELTAII